MTTVLIGALAPLTPPGWAGAGRHLLAGMELAVRDVNDRGGARLELVVRDTAADPARAGTAVAELAALGVAAIAGEYHSVVARAVAARADALGVPFLCSSAVLDALTEEPTDLVARIAPAQSRSWRVYADFLRAAGHGRVAVAAQPSVYWTTGTSVLREHLDTVVELDLDQPVGDQLVEHDATALLLLVGHPEPALSIVRAVRDDERVATTLIGAPAGQPEFAEWATPLGAGIPFLRYLPRRLTPLGDRVAAALRERLAEPPSFVAFEGYDTIAVLAEKLRAATASWPSVDGTRGPIEFSRVPGIGVWQWAWPPIQVVDRDPAAPDSFRVLR